MGDINDRLGEFLEPLLADAVEHQGQNNGDGESPEKVEQVEQQGIGNQTAEQIRIKEGRKVLKPNPGTAHNSLGNLEILKGYLDAVEGNIVEDDEIQNPRQQQHIDLPIPLQPGCNWNTVAAPRAPRRRIRFQEKTSFS